MELLVFVGFLFKRKASPSCSISVREVICKFSPIRIKFIVLNVLFSQKEAKREHMRLIPETSSHPAEQLYRAASLGTGRLPVPLCLLHTVKKQPTARFSTEELDKVRQHLVVLPCY